MHRPTFTRALAAVSATALLLGSVALTGPTSAEPAPRATAKGAGDIALRAGAYGTRVEGGQVPADSSATAFIVIGCSTQPGIDRDNVIADAELPGAGDASAVKSRVWTRRDGAEMHSYSRNSTAEVVLSESPLGKLSIRGVTSLSHAWYDGSRFRSESSTSIGKIVFTPPVGPAQEIDIPTPGEPVTVPGVATLRIGQSNEKQSATGAQAWAVALRVTLIPSGTDVFIARSKAQALSGVKYGRFGGYSAGTEASVLGGVLTSGRNPLTLMPCQGTNGKVIGKDDADLDLGGQLHVEGVSSKAWAKRFDNRSEAWERGSIASLDLGGQLQVEAVVGKAKVTRMAGGKRILSTEGTRIGAITFNGEPQELPLDQVLEIPGVAKLEPKLVEKLPAGLKVIALRITLLDGSGAVLDLGVAKTTIRK